MKPLIYSIDTSALIFLDREYSYDVFPALWDNHIIGLIEEGRLIASEEVKEELKRGDDELYDWISNNCSQMFIKTNDVIMSQVAQLLVQYPNLVNSDKPSKDQADPFVIALAIEAPNICEEVCDEPDCVVVTYEQKTGNMNGPKMPDVCQACQIKVIKLIDIFKYEGWKFAA